MPYVAALAPEDRAAARFWRAEDGAVRFQVQAELTVQPDHLMAALYGYAASPPEELTVQDLGELIAAELAIVGLAGLHQHAEQIAVEERAGTLRKPEWLDRCRQRVNGILADVAPRGLRAAQQADPRGLARPLAHASSARSCSGGASIVSGGRQPPP